MGRDGMGWHVMAWDGMGWDGMACDGMGWDGLGWHAMAWHGMQGWNGCASPRWLCMYVHTGMSACAYVWVTVCACVSNPFYEILCSWDSCCPGTEAHDKFARPCLWNA